MSTTTDEFLSLKQAAARLGPRRGGATAKADTVRSWCLHGLHGVRLHSQLRGGVRVTTAQWLDDFFRDVEAAKGRVPPGPSRAAIKRADQAAVERLRKRGLMA